MSYEVKLSYDIKCHCCDKRAQAGEVCELPQGWGFVSDQDPMQPDGMGSFYACPEHKET